MRTLAIAALMVAAATLTGCGGGGPTTLADLTDEELEELRSEPGAVRLQTLAARADTLLSSDAHSRYAITAGIEPFTETLVEAVFCAGARCVGADGTATTVADLLDPAAETVAQRAALGSRGGFDTLTFVSRFDVTERVGEVTVTVSPQVSSYGLWGAHGFAALALGAGALSGEVSGTAFEGNFSLTAAWALGEATGSNPAGPGGATWTGIAEATSRGTFERLQGTATVSIADLAQPRVSVAIEVPGHTIGAPGWDDMALSGGHFSAGEAGTNYLAGNFHGPDHDEAWGVFDTTGHIGAFGARREP